MQQCHLQVAIIFQPVEQVYIQENNKMESMVVLIPLHLLYHLSWFTLASLFLFTALSEANSKPCCQKECGNLSVSGVLGTQSSQKECGNLTVPDLLGTQSSQQGCENLTVPDLLGTEKGSSEGSRDWKTGKSENEVRNPGSVQVQDMVLPPSRQRDAFPHKLIDSRTTKLNYRMRNGKGYIRYIKTFPVSLTLGLGFCCSFLFFAISGIYSSVKKQMFIKHKSNYFQKNGGLLLEQHINASQHGSIKVLTAEELARATDYYKESHNFDPSGCGEIERFISEIVTLTKIDHQNVVKFLGYCLETEAPTLVYELASNGTLFDYIHYHTNSISSLPWHTLLKIASESAAALAYLHFASIIHGNFKSSNILLSDCFVAKVFGLGPSRLVPSNESQISTLVQRTLGYLDPEYFFTGQLTQKSDVYSFGVVLIEILTGEKPISFGRPENQTILSSHFVLSMDSQNGLFDQILAPQVVKEGNREQVRAVAELATRCLKLSSAERPTMEVVAAELKWLSDVQPLSSS